MASQYPVSGISAMFR